MKFRVFVLGILAFASTCFAQQPATPAPLRLLDRLAGDWVMTGRLGSKQTTHDVHAEWVLSHEYLRLHEVSREKDAKGAPAYEAIIFIEWNEKRHEYVCQWLDSTEGGGLYGPLAHAQPMPDSMPFIFTLSPTERMETTFAYSEHDNRWHLTIDDVTNGKSERFGDVWLARNR